MAGRAGPGGRTPVAALLLAAAALAVPAPAAAQSGGHEPTPEVTFAVDALPRPCALEGNDPYERRIAAEMEGWGAPDYERYPGHCRRLRFSYGPIHVKPGQNDVLVEPVKIEKPMRDGFVTRFKPNLVRADGSVPPVEQVHLHHGTWLSVPEYGDGPFAASGEEKTTFPWPRGYGMPIKATDQWLLLYMVHSAVQTPMELFITYDVDFVPQADAEEIGMKPALPVWLDVRPGGYPVFNVQRSFGGADGRCTWPREQCAAHDPFGKVLEGQGELGNGKGTDLELPKFGERLGTVESFTGGTLIGLGGHLHPGGIRNEIDLIRPGGELVKVRERVPAGKRSGRRRAKPRYRLVKKRVDTARIYNGEAVYWDRKDPLKPGGPPTSWDFSMEVVGLPRWGVRVKPGDVLRSNATYDTTRQSTYENMGIVVGLLVPDTPDGQPQAPGVNPLSTPKDGSEACASSAGIRAKRPRLCQEGLVTHGHYRENGNFSGPEGTWDARTGSPTSEVGVVDFLYVPGDLSMISMTGVPTVKLGSTLRFTDLEGPLVYHTATSCRFPCLGPTGTDFPIADGATSTGRQLDFDSSEMGVGVPYIGPTKERLDYQIDVTPQAGFKPGEIVTYYCRIHPGMRGAFEVSAE
ncbi:MAG TPA: hypothetical protein VF520_01750 [Thermoleophilaceae bacterium]